MDILALITHIKNRSFVPRPPAFLAEEFDVGEKLHLYRYGSVALASLATAAGNVEGEVPGGVPPLLRFRQRGKQFADSVECLDVGNRIRAWGAADRRLIDEDDLFDLLAAFESLE